MATSWRSSPSPRPLPTSLVHVVRGQVLSTNAKPVEAAEQHRAALTAIEAYGPNHPRRATLLTLLARSIDRQGHVAGAREHFDEAARILEAAGERHVFELAQLHMLRGDLGRRIEEADEATKALRRSVALFETDEHYKPYVARSLKRDDDVTRLIVGQATCDALDGEIADARDGLERVEKEVGTGATAPWRGGRLELLRAELALREGNLAEARLHADRARAIYALLGPALTMDVDQVDGWLADHPP